MAGNEITVDDRDLIIAVLRGAATTWREAAADPGVRRAARPLRGEGMCCQIAG
jgi:hypothetical protein